MKKSIIAAALLVAGFSNAAYNGPYDGVVKFDGEVINQTCEVVTGSSLTENDQTVTLPKVRKKDLDTAGKVAGTTPFAIKLTNCTAPSNYSVKAQFVDSSLVDVANNYTLKNTTVGGAENVNLQLTNVNTAQAIRIGDAVSDNVQTTPITAEETVLRYNVQYYATAAAGEGKVTSQVEYNIVYE